MERGYLIAVLAIIATFTGFSRGFQSVEQWSLLHLRNIQAMAKAECHAHSAARAIAKIETRLRPHYAKKAQLLAEMNLPLANVQPGLAEEMARQNVETARCARARAMQEVERARRDMVRMQRDMAHISVYQPITPLSLQISLPPNLDEQIRQSTEMAGKIAARQIKLQIAADHLNAAEKKPTCPEQ